MSHPLQQRVDAVERRVRRLRWCYGLACFLLAAAAVVAAASLADFFLRLHDPGLRWILSLAVAAGLGWACWRWVIPAVGTRLNRIEVAQRIERRFPRLGKRLSSAIAFLSQSADDPTAGSLDLRRAVVAETEALSGEMDFQDVVEPRRPRRLLAAAGLVVIAAIAVAVASPTLVRLGLTRLATPWGNDAWPARHALAFAAAPRVLAVGDDFDVEVIDRNGELPDVVELQLRRLADGRDEVHAMKRLGDRMVLRLDNVTQPFAFRAVGGDDYHMAWTTLEVVSPPKITDLVMEVTPPTYAAWPTEQGRKLVRALAGSQIVLRGKVDKPIKSASLKTGNNQTLPVRVAVSADGKSFQAPADGPVPWLAEKSGEVWCEVTDDSALPTGRQERIELQVVADAPPTISWEAPADHALVTPRALVPIRALIKDDLAIARIELRYLRPDASDQGEQVLELYVGKPAAEHKAGDPPARTTAGQSLALDTAWDLALIPSLAEGSVLAVRIVAEDFKPQQTTAVVRRLTIISEEELENRVVQQQSSILTQLAEVLRLQREARDQTAELEIRLKETGQLEPRDLSHLQSAELNQRQVQRLLSDPQDGVEARIIALLDELAHNRVSSQAAADRMNELLEKVRRLGKEELAGISHELTAALKTAQAAAESNGPSGCAADAPADVSQSLATAGAGQQRVIDALESLLGDLSQWDNFSRLAREIGQIRSDQTELADETDRLRLELAASDSPDAAAIRASSRQFSRRQVELARRYEKLQSRMTEMRQRLAQSDPLVAGTLTDALDAARRLAIGGRMRSASGELQDVRPGAAHQTQQQVLDGLAELQDVLSRRRDAELARTTQSLKQATADLESLAQRQQQLRRGMQQAAADSTAESRKRKLERLSHQAKKLAEEVRELSRKLERLQARRASETADQAAAAMDQSAQAAEGDQQDEAQDQAASAQDLLEETRRQLQQQIQQAEQDLLREQLVRLEQQIEGLIARQKNVIAETMRLEDFRGQQNGSLTDPQRATLRGIAGEERLLADETGQLGSTVQQAAAFVLGLEGVQAQLKAAAERLEAGETGAATKDLEEDALRRLMQVREALKPEESAPPEPQDDQQQPPAAPNDAAAPTANLAELKLLKLMQEEIQRQTAELERLRLQAGQLDEQQTQRLEALAREQGKLANMVMDMIKTAAERPEDSLPDLPMPAETGGGKGDKKGEQRGTLDAELLKDLEGKR